MYARIDTINKERNEEVCDIQSALRYYKYILIEENEGNRTLHSLGQDRFYENLFQVLLLDEKIQYFDKDKFLMTLDLKSIERLVEVRAIWQDVYDASPNKVYAHLTWWSRYHRYWELDFIYLYRFHKEGFDTTYFELYKEYVTKYFLIQSVVYKRVVNGTKTFCYKLIRLMLANNNSEQDIIAFLKDEFKKIDKNHLEYQLSLNDIFEVHTKKNLLTRISAMIEEKDGFSNQNYRKYFYSEESEDAIDIEHIHPQTPVVEPEEDWSDYSSTIGNLVVLENSINRSIQNISFDKKLQSYNGSKFPIVKNMITEYPDKQWTITKCEDRTKTEIKKLMAFFFEGLD